MKVFKFGGASVKDAAAIANLKDILLGYQDEKTVVVVSAMGKTTNFLEQVLDSYRNGKEDLDALVEELELRHQDTVRQLFGSPGKSCEEVENLFGQLREQLRQPVSDNYDYDYDRIVSFGELLSTTIISDYLNSQRIGSEWVDARRIIRTDNTYREGRVDWDTTGRLVRCRFDEFLKTNSQVLLTQGFIAGTAENQTTTLGREGSDYSAAILAYSLDAESVTVWKDVPGILNADPKRFPDAVKIDTLTYYETVELAYYGASVIHPKTLRPLHQKNIPLFVKSFFNPGLPGTKITGKAEDSNLPSIIVKDNQLLVSISPRDFSIIGVDSLSEILSILSEHRLKINMMQNSALTFTVCTDNRPMSLTPCLEALKQRYVVKYNDDVELITIRHYDTDTESRVLKDREVYIRQNSRHTLQAAVAKK